MAKAGTGNIRQYASGRGTYWVSLQNEGDRIGQIMSTKGQSHAAAAAMHWYVGIYTMHALHARPGPHPSCMRPQHVYPHHHWCMCRARATGQWERLEDMVAKDKLER